MEIPIQKRGVENPRIVDLITHNKETNEVILVMIETRDWGSEPKQLKQIEDKYNTYLGYILDGFLVKDYPQYDGYRACIRIDCKLAPREEEQDFFRAVSQYAESQNIKFEINVLGEDINLTQFD